MHIAVYAFNGITMFHLSIPQMVFETVSRLGLADWKVSLFTAASESAALSEGTTNPAEGMGPAPADEAGLGQRDRPQAQADDAGAPCMCSLQ